MSIILTGFALGAAAVGIGAQAEAKETNEKAQSIIKEAQDLYNNTKESLENAQGMTEQSLISLGNAKKQVIETSIHQFLDTYNKIKNIELSESVGLNEIRNFSLEKQDAIQLREMSDIYQSTFSSGVAGAATGAVIALAASGSLPIVTGTLSVAGTALAAGEISMAAGLAGSALSFGAAMTPLAAIAAPAMLFSGISASIKADENLERAKVMYAEAEEASEKMKTSEVLCIEIAKRADMYNNLLGKLNGMFSHCTGMLNRVISKRKGIFGSKKVDCKKLTEDELKLIAVTRALAGAVKAVIDTPILSADGAVSYESETVYKDTVKRLPAFTSAVNEISTISHSSTRKSSMVQKTAPSGNRFSKAMHILALIIRWYFTVSFLLSGISVLATVRVITGLLWLASGMLICPLLLKKIKTSMKIVLAIILFIIGSAMM